MFRSNCEPLERLFPRLSIASSSSREMINLADVFTHPPVQTHIPRIQTMRDRAELYGRIKILGPQFQEVRARLQGNIKRDIKGLAARFIEKYHISPMDRLEKRTFDGLVTWFCRYDVLHLLDCEDERKLGLMETDPKDTLETTVDGVVDSRLSARIDPFGEEGEDDGMDDMHSDFGTMRFTYPF
jgi:hypothetical protein